MTKLLPRAAWLIAGADGREVELDVRIVPLVRAVARYGTLTAAAEDRRLPYRTAWALLEAAERAVGAALIGATRGRGARLTALGERLLTADGEAQAQLRSRAWVLDVAGDRAGVAAATLAVAASHDLALAQLRDRWRLAERVAVEFHGSAESLAAYEAGSVDVAGFHVVREARKDDPLLALLRPGRDALIRFLRRAQGLILPAGNPRRVRGLADLASRRLRIVNRQPGSGTRYLFDRLLEQAGVDGAALAGYSSEEFTHAAVAATVAAGNAEAGFGVRAAAAQLGLAFVPLAEEDYLFACRARALESPAVARFRALLADAATRAVVTPLPGYRLDRPGSLRPFGARAVRAAPARKRV